MAAKASLRLTPEEFRSMIIIVHIVRAESEDCNWVHMRPDHEVQPAHIGAAGYQNSAHAELRQDAGVCERRSWRRGRVPAWQRGIHRAVTGSSIIV